MAEVVRAMRNPVLVLVTLSSLGLHDLRPTMTGLRALLRGFRRNHLRGVRAATGSIEPKLAADGRRWAVHAHLVLDVDAVPWARVRAAWRSLTRGRGIVKEDPRPVRRRNPGALVSYVTKTWDACPAPGKLPPEILDLLWTGIRGLQLPVNWGPHVRRGRRKP